jgi:uncharacterized protein (TIGR00645 family)
MMPNLEKLAAWFSQVIFWGRWVIAPLYAGLLFTGLLLSYKFYVKLVDLFKTASVLSGTELILGVLHLIDIVMVANLLVVTMVGGYSLFVQRVSEFNTRNHLPWLQHFEPGALKVKLGMALIGISSIHLLEAFIDIKEKTLMELSGLVTIHLVFVISTVAIAGIKGHGKSE